jgi:polysaccharide pyruvyl transferase WcaK-like protein
MRIVVLADIGQPIYHVGDEAMAHAAVPELAARGVVDVVLLTRDVEDSRRRFSTDAVSTVPFPPPPLEREEYLRDITKALSGDSDALPAGDPAWDVFRAVESSDGVLIAGGGNLNSAYGWLLYERAAVGRIAAHYGKPLVVSGQTLGPVLVGPDAGVLQELLASAKLVGIREASSLELARSWGLDGGRVVAGCDDASFIASASGPATQQAGQAPDGEEYIVATFSERGGAVPQAEFYRKTAEMLDQVAELTGLKILLTPHMGTPGKQDSDVKAHSDIQALTTSGRVESLPIADAVETARLTAGASLVLSSRYHPLVFALDGCTPAVGLSVDAYSDVRLKGALVNWGLPDLSLTLPSLLSGEYLAAVQKAWARRAEIREHLSSLRGIRLAESAAWWDAVVAVFAGDRPGPIAGLSPAPELQLTGGETEGRRRVFNALTAEVSVCRLELERLWGEHELRRAEAEAAAAELERLRSSRSFRLARKLASPAAVVRRLGRPRT